MLWLRSHPIELSETFANHDQPFSDGRTCVVDISFSSSFSLLPARNRLSQATLIRRPSRFFLTGTSHLPLVSIVNAPNYKSNHVTRRGTLTRTCDFPPSTTKLIRGRILSTTSPMKRRQLLRSRPRLGDRMPTSKRKKSQRARMWAFTVLVSEISS